VAAVCAGLEKIAISREMGVRYLFRAKKNRAEMFLGGKMKTYPEFY
jgi:hypothetical protein